MLRAVHAEGKFQLRAEALEWREVEGQIVALDLRASRYFSVNRTGAAVWPALVAGANRDELCRTLTEEFGIVRKIAERDLDSFLTSLSERELLES